MCGSCKRSCRQLRLSHGPQVNCVQRRRNKCRDIRCSDSAQTRLHHVLADIPTLFSNYSAIPAPLPPQAPNPAGSLSLFTNVSSCRCLCPTRVDVACITRLPGLRVSSRGRRPPALVSPLHGFVRPAGLDFSFTSFPKV